MNSLNWFANDRKESILFSHNSSATGMSVELDRNRAIRLGKIKTGSPGTNEVTARFARAESKFYKLLIVSYTLFTSFSPWNPVDIVSSSLTLRYTQSLVLVCVQFFQNNWECVQVLVLGIKTPNDLLWQLRFRSVTVLHFIFVGLWAFETKYYQ